MTPAEYVDIYSKDLMSYMDKYDIQINKLGIIGYFMNLFAWNHYDSKNYYDSLYRDSFVATASTEHALRLHGSVYGYFPDFANYSIANGKFIFDFSDIPLKQKDVLKREIVFSDIVFKINNISFYTDATYKFYEDGGSYYCLVVDKNKVISIPSSTSKIEVGFVNVKQLESTYIEIPVQNYRYGTFFPRIITLNNTYMSSIQLRVDESELKFDPSSNFDEYGIEYEVKSVKYLDDSNDRICFLKHISNYDYLLEFGNGVRGKYIPNTNAVAKVLSTSGLSGNINISSTPSISNCKFRMSNYKVDGSIFTGSISPSYLKVEFNYSEGGKNPLSGTDLRRSLTEFIRTRDNFISETDYYNITKKYLNDFTFLFRKGIPFENTFYLNRCFRNRFQEVSHAMNITQQMVWNGDTSELQFIVDNNDINVVDGMDNYLLQVQYDTDNMIVDRYQRAVLDMSSRVVYSMFTPSLNYGEMMYVFFPTGNATHGGKLQVGRYTYQIKATDGFCEFSVGNMLEVYVNGINHNAVRLDWDNVPGAVKYKVYGRPNDSGHFRTWDVYDTYFIDTGDESDVYIPTITTNKLIFYPEFRLYGKDFVSPFVYEYDDTFGWYKGYILYSDIMVYFDTTTNINTTYSLPLIFFKIEYDKTNHLTNIYIKSYEDISEYSLYLTILGTNISSRRILTLIDKNTWILTYVDSTYGLFFNELSIELDVFKDDIRIMTGQTSKFNQMYNIEDQLKLFLYRNHETDVQYLVNIPVIDKSIFYSDQNYYMNKVHEFLYSMTFSENRAPGVEMQFRFLNTYVIPRDYLYYLTKQKYDNFDMFLPLKLEIKAYIKDDIYDVDLNEEKNKLTDSVAKLLEDSYTGTSIKYYNSQIIDFVHSNRDFIKKVEVITKDYRGTVISDGIETIDNYSVERKILDDVWQSHWERKLKVLKYNSPFFYWDVNNINIKFMYS